VGNGKKERSVNSRSHAGGHASTGLKRAEHLTLGEKNQISGLEKEKGKVGFCVRKDFGG